MSASNYRWSKERLQGLCQEEVMAEESTAEVAEPGRGTWEWMCEESTTAVDGFVAASELVSGRRALLEYGVREDEIPF